MIGRYHYSYHMSADETKAQYQQWYRALWAVLQVRRERVERNLRIQQLEAWQNRYKKGRQ